MALQNCAIETINTFLNNIYYIPNYQREYSWESNELGDFWDDLCSTKDNGENSNHFFGQIVVHNDEISKRKYIIDGQQRTITSTIFMRTLQYFYDIIYKETNSQMADYRKSDIASIHIGRYLSPTQNNLHLHLGDLDNEYFRTTVQLGTPDNCTKVKKKSHERIRKAYVFFHDKIKESLSGHLDVDDQLDILNDYYDAFTNRFSVLYMEATQLDEAFVIFETLNARGKELETADLLKNFIFSQIKDISLAQSQWNSMINILDRADPTKYIRHYWNATKNFTREKELYSSISKNISSPRESKELLKNLSLYAQCYHDICIPEECIGFTDIALIDSLKALKALKAKTFYPVILALKQAQCSFTEANIRVIVQTIETYIFRNFTICGKVANKTEVFFADIAKSIYDGSLDTVEAIVDKINAKMVTDTEFYEMFKIWNSSNKDYIRYTLRKIHKHLDHHNEINVDNTEVHIEHIMPEDNTIWQIPEEIHEAYLWRLGNLALLSGSINSSISNKNFEEKKQRYTESKIEPNKQISSFEVWTPTQIDERQEMFANYALKIWKK